MPLPKVIHLVISLKHGGLEQLVVQWTNARNRVSPGSTSVVCLDEAGELAPQVDGGAVQVLQARRARFPWDIDAVRRIRQLAPAVIHAHNLAAWQYAVLAKLAGCWSRRPWLVYTQHGANVHNRSLVDRLRGRLLAGFTDEVVSVSAATANVMARLLWLSARRIRVVPNGIAMDAREGREPSITRESVHIPRDAMVIGSVGRLAHVKGYDRLLRVFATMPLRRMAHGAGSMGQGAWSMEHGAWGGRQETGGREQGGWKPSGDRIQESGDGRPEAEAGNCNEGCAHTGEACLLLLGDGPERPALEVLSHDLEIADRVRFAGFQPDVRQYLPLMDLFVLSSRSEGLSIALLEAMAMGVPAAVTDVGANREVIDDGRAGFLLSDHESDWADQLRDILGDPDRLQAVSHAARVRVAQHYSMSANLAAYEAAYVAARRF